MDIETIVEKKKLLEQLINDEIEKFEEECNVSIDSLDLYVFPAMGLRDKKRVEIIIKI